MPLKGICDENSGGLSLHWLLAISTEAVSTTKSEARPTISFFRRWMKSTDVGCLLEPPNARIWENKFSTQSWLRWLVIINFTLRLWLSVSNSWSNDLLLMMIPFWKGNWDFLLPRHFISSAVSIILFKTDVCSCKCTPKPHWSFVDENFVLEFRVSNLKVCSISTVSRYSKQLLLYVIFDRFIIRFWKLDKKTSWWKFDQQLLLVDCESSL